MSSVSEVKAELIKLGLSTHTPGMVGLERLDELRARLDSAKSKTRALLPPPIALLRFQNKYFNMENILL